MFVTVYHIYFCIKSRICNGEYAPLAVISDSFDRYSLRLHFPALFSPLALGS